MFVPVVLNTRLCTLLWLRFCTIYIMGVDDENLDHHF
jgi:hypothetical protein